MIVLLDAMFGCLEVHCPAAFPVVGFAWVAIKYMTRVAVLEATDLISFEFD
jgi:hypothetical protein